MWSRPLDSSPQVFLWLLPFSIELGTKPLAEASNAEISAWAHDIGLPDRGRALAGVDGAILASTTPEELKAQLNLQPRQWNDFIQSLEAAKDSGVTIVNRLIFESTTSHHHELKRECRNTHIWNKQIGPTVPGAGKCPCYCPVDE